MKLKTQIEFEMFNDGNVRIYETDENDNIIPETYKNFRFGEEKVGITRFYSAKQNDVEISRVIHVHKCSQLRTDMAAVINSTRYKIEQIQHDSLKNPPITIISLSQRGLYLEAENDF